MRVRISFLLIFFSQLLFAQPTQTIRGRVIDKISKIPLSQATVILKYSEPLKGVTTDNHGYFNMENVALGRQDIVISYLGYKTKTIHNLMVKSAKEVVLLIELEENVILQDEVTIKAHSFRNETINKMNSVSARSFSVEETEKYAGSRGDVARMAMNYAGVSGANDSRNDIIIRGNSPSGLLWRLDEIVIPNPNHFAENGTTGGPVGMLNNNLLSNSDFFTGAFPAEYGNATSGVFDLRMRNGNYENHEFLFQVGFNGFELGAEGPLNNKTKASYLVNVRYSTLELIDKFIDMGNGGVPKYKDVSYKLNFPLKNGNLSFIALAGSSKISMFDSKKDKSEEELNNDLEVDLVNHSKMIMQGISYTHLFNDKLYLKLIASGVYEEGGTIIDTLDYNRKPHLNVDHNFENYKLTLSASLNHKLNRKFSTKYGFVADKLGYKLLTKVYDDDLKQMKKEVDNSKSVIDGPNLFQLYAQSRWQLNQKLIINGGVNYQYFGLNNTSSLEPRLGASWQLNNKNKLSLGYGLHSKIQALSTYFLGTWLDNGNYVETNKKLDFSKAHHFVFGYDLSINNNTRLKTEIYYQDLFNIPVTQRESSFSIINSGASWGIAAEDSLINTGTGKNYGVELTLERFFSNNLYYLTTLSLFESKYKGSDNIERNTMFNGNYILNFLAGKEFQINQFSTLNLDIKLSYAGGRYYTPVDLEESQAKLETVWDDENAYSKQLDPFFKTDLKIGYRLNGKKTTQEWLFYIENVTNHKNQFMQVYDRSKNEVKFSYQLGFFPMMQYKIQF